MKVRFYDSVQDEKLRFAVIAVWCRSGWLIVPGSYTHRTLPTTYSVVDSVVGG